MPAAPSRAAVDRRFESESWPESRSRRAAPGTPIARGCYFRTGDDSKVFTKTIVGNAYGVVIAWIAVLIIVNVSIAALGVIWPAIVVGVTVFLLVIVASYEPLSAVPANVYGYAATVAYSLHQPSQAGAGPLENLTAASFGNPLPLPIVSMVLGAVFGLISGRVAGAMTKQATPA